MTFSAESLPKGLSLDPNNGNITGTASEAGTFAVKFTARNALGQDSKTISFVIGPMICLTPPHGMEQLELLWSSYRRSEDSRGG